MPHTVQSLTHKFTRTIGSLPSLRFPLQSIPAQCTNTTVSRSTRSFGLFTHITIPNNLHRSFHSNNTPMASSSSTSPSTSPEVVAPSTDRKQPQHCTSHFVTGDYHPVVSFLDDAQYAKCLDTLVKACNDMLLTHEGKVFLGKRQVWPQRDWWYGCGGRMKPGESVFDSSRRLLQRELKLDLSVEQLQKRLFTVGHYSFLWGKREQLPQTNGTADISVVVTMDLTSEEVAAIKADEFEHREWRSPFDILSGDFHPALKRSMQDYIKLLKFRELDSLLLGGKRLSLTPAHPLPSDMTPLVTQGGDKPINDAEMVEACKHFLRYHRYISQNDTQTIPCEERQ